MKKRCPNPIDNSNKPISIHEFFLPQSLLIKHMKESIYIAMKDKIEVNQSNEQSPHQQDGLTMEDVLDPEGDYEALYIRNDMRPSYNACEELSTDVPLHANTPPHDPTTTQKRGTSLPDTYDNNNVISPGKNLPPITISSEPIMSDLASDAHSTVDNESSTHKSDIIASKFSREAKQLLTQIANELILFITSEASERCMKEDRRLIRGEDILLAMDRLGFDRFVTICQHWLTEYNKSRKEIKSKKKQSNDETQDIQDDILKDV